MVSVVSGHGLNVGVVSVWLQSPLHPLATPLNSTQTTPTDLRQQLMAGLCVDGSRTGLTLVPRPLQLPTQWSE